MNHDNHLSGWPLVVSWALNGVYWLAAGMTHAQIILFVVTLGYTIHRWWKLRGKTPE